MHHFSYKGGVLHAEGVSIARLAAEVGTPFYCYSSETIERHYKVLAEAFRGQDALICFAVKANSNQAVLTTLAKLGAGMDVVSEGELRRARAAGVPANKIIFAGVGKTRVEMAYALKRRHSRLQRRERAGTRGAERGCVRPRSHGSYRDPGQPRRGCQDARQDLDREVREQVRRAVRPKHRGSMRRRGDCRASKSPVFTCTSAARSRI